MANPILHSGGCSDQSIYDASSTIQHEVGTRAILPGGRVFHYSKTIATALNAGDLAVIDPQASGSDEVVTGTATPAGSAFMNLEADGTYTLNEFAGGWIYTNAGTGDGFLYKIKSNPAATSGNDIRFELYDNLIEATDASTEVTFRENHYNGATRSADDNRVPLGVSPTAVAAQSYFWLQTWGPCVVLIDGTPGVGDPVTRSGTPGGSGTAGAVQALSVTIAETVVQPVVGYMLEVGADTDRKMMLLTISG